MVEEGTLYHRHRYILHDSTCDVQYIGTGAADRLESPGCDIFRHDKDTMKQTKVLNIRASERCHRCATRWNRLKAPSKAAD